MLQITYTVHKSTTYILSKEQIQTIAREMNCEDEDLSLGDIMYLADTNEEYSTLLKNATIECEVLDYSALSVDIPD